MIKVILTKDGNAKVDIDMPEGPECDATDARMRAVLVALGVYDASALNEISSDEQVVTTDHIKQGDQK